MGPPFLAEVHPPHAPSIASTNRFYLRKKMISDFVKAIGFTSQANRSFSSAVEQSAAALLVSDRSLVRFWQGPFMLFVAPEFFLLLLFL